LYGRTWREIADAAYKKTLRHKGKIAAAAAAGIALYFLYNRSQKPPVEIADMIQNAAPKAESAAATKPESVTAMKAESVAATKAETAADPENSAEEPFIYQEPDLRQRPNENKEEFMARLQKEVVDRYKFELDYNKKSRNEKNTLIQNRHDIVRDTVDKQIYKIQKRQLELKGYTCHEGSRICDPPK
jgi:hypothetical protein